MRPSRQEADEGGQVALALRQVGTQRNLRELTHGELAVDLDKRELTPVEALTELDGMSRIIDLVVAALEQRQKAVVEAVVTSGVSVC